MISKDEELQEGLKIARIRLSFCEKQIETYNTWDNEKQKQTVDGMSVWFEDKKLYESFVNLVEAYLNIPEGWPEKRKHEMWCKKVIRNVPISCNCGAEDYNKVLDSCNLARLKEPQANEVAKLIQEFAKLKREA